MDLASGYPFWPVSDGLIRVYPRLDADARCDVAVIGAGISGALVAHHLSAAGFDVLVVDRREVGWGSTSASTALLQYELDVPLTRLSQMRGAEQARRAYLACERAVEALADLATSLGRDVGFARRKSLYLASGVGDIPALRAELTQRRAIGIDVDWVGGEELETRFGLSRPGALLSRAAAEVDAYAFTHALLEWASRRGARVFDRTQVCAVDARTDGVELKLDGGPAIRARHVVFAAGYETAEFLREPVARLASTFAIATEPLTDQQRELARVFDEHVVWEHATPYLYLRRTVDHRLIIGGEDEPFRNPKRRDHLLPDKARRLVERCAELLPGLCVDPAFAWAGTFGETEDGLAYIGGHPDWPSSSFALGYGGNGITFSLLAAEIIRDRLLGEPNGDAELFRFGR